MVPYPGDDNHITSSSFVLHRHISVHQDFDNMHRILTILVEAGTDLSLCGRFSPLFSACTIGKQQ